MIDQWKREARQMFTAAKNARIPESFAVLAEDAISRSRDAFDHFQSVSTDGTRSVETALRAAQDGARVIGEKVLQNVEHNTELAFQAAQAMARAKTVPELLQLQSSFLQQHLSMSASQSMDLLGLSAKVAQQTYDTMNAVALKAFEPLKKR
jgi:hypothetical protein